ncbi:hypothetical protein M0R45_017351 [Rubus argutus]|uniref:Uncharacterized protein n=1 Tax=Rubus argutus TaxID=59490 RepID=A0AAW1XWU2_RUBAR
MKNHGGWMVMIDDNGCRKEAWASGLTAVAEFFVDDVDGLLHCNMSGKDRSRGAGLGELVTKLQGRATTMMMKTLGGL